MVIDKAKIEKEAKQILDKFAKALEKVEEEKDLDFHIDRDEFERLEGKEGCKADDNFKKRFLENAPKHDEDFVIGERGSWK
jgi:predicted Asp-tRNA(Asn)/Glu-tRNA(Gln) amidotransferase subunit C